MDPSKGEGASHRRTLTLIRTSPARILGRGTSTMLQSSGFSYLRVDDQLVIWCRWKGQKETEMPMLAYVRAGRVLDHMQQWQRGTARGTNLRAFMVLGSSAAILIWIRLLKRGGYVFWCG